MSKSKITLLPPHEKTERDKLDYDLEYLVKVFKEVAKAGKMTGNRGLRAKVSTAVSGLIMAAARYAEGELHRGGKRR